MEPRLRVTGQQVTGSAIWVWVGSGHGSKPWPGFFDPDAVNISSLHVHVAVDIIDQDGSVTVHSAQMPTTHTYANTHSTHKWATSNRKAMRRMRCDALTGGIWGRSQWGEVRQVVSPTLPFPLSLPSSFPFP